MSRAARGNLGKSRPKTTTAGQGLNAADKQLDSLTIAIGNDENTMAPFT